MNTFTDKFLSNKENKIFIQETMMGPNAMRISEEMASYLDIKKNMRVLDLGCGMGLSSLLLTQKYGVEVFAADLWITPTENYKRFQRLEITDKVIPILIDATQSLPFSERYFDILFTVDSYHYFGGIPEMLPSLIRFVKKGGYIAISVPSIKYEFGENIPKDMQPWWKDPEVKRTIRSLGFWKDLWHKANGIEIINISEMSCHKQAWDEWLASSNPYALEDLAMMEADNGQYWNTTQLIAKVI